MNLGYPLLGVTLFLIACGPSNEDMQAMVNRAVDEERGGLMQAIVEEARKNPGPSGARGPQGERGPEVGDERLAQGIQAALAAIELPVGPPGPAGPQGERGETGGQAEIPAEQLPAGATLRLRATRRESDKGREPTMPRPRKKKRGRPPANPMPPRIDARRTT